MFERLKNLDQRLSMIFGVVIILSLYWAYQWLGVATLAVTSEPTGATVTINGQVRGVTPLEDVEVEAGELGVRVAHSHFKPTTLGLSLRRGDHEQRHVVLQPGEGTLELLSNPRGAWVEVDGERLADVTPTTLTTRSGAHEIRMGLEERHVIVETHTLNHDQTLPVNFNLNIDPHGSLTITSEPRGVQVAFLDKDLNYSPKMRLPIGEYALRVSKAGYLPQEFRYKVRYGDNLHHVKLERGYGVLTVRAQPTDAELTVIFNSSGKRHREPYRQGMRVPIGAVEVRARALGHRTAHRRITLGVSGAQVNFELAAMTVTPGKELTDKLRGGGVAPVMVVVPAGRFKMGDSNGSYSEKPVREVVLTQPFAVSKTEVSIADYQRFATATGRAMPAKLDLADPSIAMAYVSYEDAHTYAEWLSVQTGEKYRIPSEAEWEYFVRAGSQTDYFFGDDPLGLCQYANIADLATARSFRDWDVLKCDDGMVRVGPVGQLDPNPFGLHDVYGNVSEWVSECGIPSYNGAPTDGSATDEGLSCASHGYRGGSWDSSAAEAKSAYRNSASTAIDDRGIRLVREL